MPCDAPQPALAGSGPPAELVGGSVGRWDKPRAETGEGTLALRLFIWRRGCWRGGLGWAAYLRGKGTAVRGRRGAGPGPRERLYTDGSGGGALVLVGHLQPSFA